MIRTETLEARFQRLYREWERTSPPTSRIEQLAMHPAYQQIIGLGPDALPLILRELERSPNHWFWALRAITGENPVQPEHRGNLAAMTQDWLSWAKDQGLEW